MYSSKDIKNIKSHIRNLLVILAATGLLSISFVIFLMIKRSLILADLILILFVFIVIFIVNYYLIPNIKYLRFISLVNNEKFSQISGRVKEISNEISKIDYVNFRALTIETEDNSGSRTDERLLYLDNNYKNIDIKVNSKFNFILNDKRILNYTLIRED